MKPEPQRLAFLLILHDHLAIAVAQWPPQSPEHVEAVIATSIHHLVEKIPFVDYYLVTIDDESERIMRDAATKHNAAFERKRDET